jgi:hypothetical protein
MEWINRRQRLASLRFGTKSGLVDIEWILVYGSRSNASSFPDSEDKVK